MTVVPLLGVRDDPDWSPIPRSAESPSTEVPQEDLECLGDRIVELSARIQVATYHLLVMIREFDEGFGWGGGFRSCAHWLNWRTGLGLGAAREKVRVARALAALPLISAAMRRGEVSYSKVRALTRVATPENEGRLLEFATAGSASHVERLIRSWRRVDRIQEAERDSAHRWHRSLVTYTDADGMLVVRGRLDPETGAAFVRALEAASDRLYETRREDDDVPFSEAPLAHRRADALGLVAEAALAADLDPGTRGDRYQVVVHVEESVLEEPAASDAAIDAAIDAAPSDGLGRPGMAMLEDGVAVSAATSRRMACDSATIQMSHGADGTILGVGRKTRTISPALRRALSFRDRTCRFPACGVRVCDGHHVTHWADGGETKLDNLVLLCRRHHVAVHEEGYRVEVQGDGAVRFFHPQGWEVEEAPPLPWPIDQSEHVLDDVVTAEGAEVGPCTGSATCDSAAVDYAWALDWIRRPEDVPAGTSGEHNLRETEVRAGRLSPLGPPRPGGPSGAGPQP